ncbi:MAG: heterodisulfide reductase-related iron-sulfur binding cluster [Pedobacter sp.]
MNLRQIIFTPLLLISLAILGADLIRKARMISLGAPEQRWRGIIPALTTMLHYAFAQARVLREGFGINHFLIFWAFIALIFANIEFMVNGVLPSLSLALLPDSLYLPLRSVADIMAGVTALAVVTALLRRSFFPPYREARSFESYIILVLVAIHMLGYIGVSAAEIAHGKERAAALMPLAATVAGLFPADLAAVETLFNIFWWLHAAALLTFIAVLVPFTKHLHVITAIVNCGLIRADKPNTQPREEFLLEAVYGAGQVDRLSWKDLLDSFACTKCGRCQNVCPATYTGKPLNPRLLIDAIRHNLLANGSALRVGQHPPHPLIATAGEESIPPEAIWACTTCGACMEACPVFIEHLPKIVKLRRHLVEMEANFPEELLNLFENMEGRSNPWGIAPGDRTKWCAQMEAKPFENGVTEYLLYIGCAGSFDSRSKHVSVALTQLLDKAGVSWGILGKDEKCCGDSLRRLGNEYVYDRMAKENVAIFRERGVRKVITQCPHCFSTLKNDYRQHGLELEVIHHSELLRNLIQDGRLRPNTETAVFGSVVFHDSCYLGRHNDVYDAPREAIKAATGSVPAEMSRNRGNAFCCGAGGGRMWMEEHTGERINIARVKEALEEKPDTICVSCPYCMTMFEDGLKDVNAEGVQVRDVAEVLAEAVLR